MRQRGAVGGVALAAALLLSILPATPAAPTVPEGRCSLQRVKGKLAADCFYRELRNVPDYLSTDIQVLELSYNRIQNLYVHSFARYTWLEKLFFEDNTIDCVEEGAFEPLQRLQELSLAQSLKGLPTFPPELLHLPSLVALDVSSNRFQADALDAALTDAPPDATLERLSLAKCSLRRLPPSLARLPRLHFLNVSLNALGAVEVATLAPLCSLKELALPKDAVVERCDCKLLELWKERDGLRVWLERDKLCDPGSDEECAEQMKEAEVARAACRQELLAQESRARTRLLWRAAGGAAIAVFVIVAAAVLYCWCRRRRRTNRPNRERYMSRSKADDVEEEESEEMQIRGNSWMESKEKH